MTALEDHKIFLASKPAAQREFRTVEFFHPDFSIVQRFVSDFVPQILTLESIAPRNPSTAVVFGALSMDIVEPTENEEGVQILTITMGATNNEIQDQLRLITPANRFIRVECIYRKFYSGNLTEPILVDYLSVSSVNFDGYTKNKIIAEDMDLENKSSGEIYTLSRFPTLRDV